MRSLMVCLGLAWLTVLALATVLTGDDAPDTREAAVRIYRALQEADEQPTGESRAALERLLAESERVQPPPWRQLVKLAERLDRFDRAEQFARDWLRASPAEVEAHTAVYLAVAEQGRADDARKALQSLVKWLSQHGDSDSYDRCIDELLDRGSQDEAVVVFTDACGGARLDSSDLSLLAFEMLREMPLPPVASGSPADRKTAAGLMQIVEGVIPAHLAVGATERRPDIVLQFLATYRTALQHASALERGVEFVDRLSNELKGAEIPADDKVLLGDILDRCSLTLLWDAGRRREASRMAKLRLDELLKQHQTAPLNLHRLFPAFADAFAIVEDADLRAVYLSFRTAGYADPHELLQSPAFQVSMNESLTHENARNALNTQGGLWLEVQRKKIERLLNERLNRDAVEAAGDVSRSLGMVVHVHDSDELPFFDRESELEASAAALALFGHALATRPAPPPGMGDLAAFDLSGEKWFNSPPLGLAELQGKIVVLVGGHAAVAEGNLLNLDDYLASLHEKFSGKPVQLIEVIDDDDGARRGAGDEWRPEPSEELSNPRSYAAVYSWQSKLIDALGSGGSRWALIFDGEGRLRRVIGDDPRWSGIESLEGSVERLLGE